jgi:hypothetical protein
MLTCRDGGSEAYGVGRESSLTARRTIDVESGGGDRAEQLALLGQKMHVHCWPVTVLVK